MLDASPDSKYSQNHVESKTRAPQFVSICRDDITQTQVCRLVVISSNGEVLDPHFCSGYHNMTMKISMKAIDGP